MKIILSVSGELKEELLEHPAVKRVYGRMFAYDVPVTVNFGSGEQVVEVSAVLADSPFVRVKGVETVICSEELFRSLTGADGRNYTIVDIQLNRTAVDADAEYIRSLAGEKAIFSDRRMSNDEVRGVFYSFALFLYGFLVIIALIAFFNIVNSIGMSVSARLLQYKAMRAIGISEWQVIRMIAAETTAYVAAGMAAGCLLGLPVNRMLFNALVTSRWGTAWYIPGMSLVIILFIVGVSAVIAIYNPGRRIRKVSPAVYSGE